MVFAVAVVVVVVVMDMVTVFMLSFVLLSLLTRPFCHTVIMFMASYGYSYDSGSGPG